VHTECEEYGKYSIGKIGSVSGILVHVSSKERTTHDACDPIDNDLFPSEPWIALAQYGNCRDSVKLKNIANTNASAAVIYNNKAGARLIKMHHKGIQLYSYIIYINLLSFKPQNIKLYYYLKSIKCKFNVLMI
jgi:hypothetical protein